MMSDGYEPFPIYDFKYGKFTYKKPWLTPPDAFTSLINAYIEKGTLKKRKGYTEWGRFVYSNMHVIGVGDAGGTKTFTDAGVTYGSNGLQPGSVSVKDHGATETFTDNGDGTLSSTLGGTGTVTYATGAVSVTFNTAPANGEDVECTYSYYAGAAVMGISQYDKQGSADLIVFDTKRMNRYNSTSKLLEDKTLADTWTGDDNDFFHTCSASDDKLYITNNKDQIRTWDGSNIALHVVDYDDDAVNEVNTCKFIFEYKQHLVLLATTEEGVYRGRRMRCSAAGDFTDYPSTHWVDCPTRGDIRGARFIGTVLYVFFSDGTTWALNYIGLTTQPFQWDRVSAEEGCSAPFSPVNVPGHRILMIGETGMLAFNTVDSLPVDQVVQDHILKYALDKIAYTYGTYIKDLRQAWFTFCAPGSSLPDRVFVYNVDDGTFFEYYMSMHCFGAYSQSSTPTIDEIEDTWDEADYAFDDISLTAGFPLTLGGTSDGYIMLLNNGADDDGDEIYYEWETGEWNPYAEKMQKARLGYIDFFLDSHATGELTLKFYINTEVAPYKTVTLDFQGSGTQHYERIHVGCTGSSHRIKATHTEKDQTIEINAIVPYFKPAGPLR